MTIFTQIIQRNIPADIVYESDDVIAFRDINPTAPVHILVVPKKPIPSLASSHDDDTLLLGLLLRTAARIAEEQGIASSGYRTVINHGDDAGQTVNHLHIHLIGGKTLGWPPFTDTAKQG